VKHRIIHINDISDIDTSSITVYDLNNRYVDSLGRMYGIRYNRAKKKVEIIRLMRAHSNDASYYAHRVAQNRNVKPDEHEDKTPLADEIEDAGPEEEMPPFDPDRFIKDTLVSSDNHRRRIQGIIKNLENSNVVNREDKTMSLRMDDLYQKLEIDGIEKLENISTVENELKNYPRSVTYYQSRMDRKGLEMMEKLGHDTDLVMRFIYLAEFFDITRTAYSTLMKTLDALREFVDEHNLDQTKGMTNVQKQELQDALTSLQSTYDEVEKIMDGLYVFEKYLYELNTYSD
jgi:hypothetical protein